MSWLVYKHVSPSHGEIREFNSQREAAKFQNGKLVSVSRNIGLLKK